MNKNNNLEKKVLTLFSELFIIIELMKKQKIEKTRVLKDDKSVDDYIELYKKKKGRKFDLEFDTAIISKKILKFVSHTTSYRNLKTDLNNNFEKICRLSENQNYFWHNCSFEIYKNHYYDFKKSYINSFSVEEVIDFLVYEINYFLSTSKNTEHFTHEMQFPDYFKNLDYIPYLNEKNTFKIKSSDNKKIEFLKMEIKNEGFSFEIVDGEVKIKNGESIIDNYISEPDLKLEQLPKLNLQTRCHILYKLGIDKIIHTSIDSSQVGKQKLLAVLMNIHPDNAKHILNGTYKDMNNKDFEKLEIFIKKEDIDIQLLEP